MNIRGLFTYILVVCAFIHTAQSAEITEIDIDDPAFTGNRMCPVIPDDEVLPEYSTMYKGQRIYFCCKNCIGDWEEEPDRYLPNLPEDIRSQLNIVETVTNTEASAENKTTKKTIEEIAFAYTLFFVCGPIIILILWYYSRKLFVNYRFKEQTPPRVTIIECLYLGITIILMLLLVEDIKSQLEIGRDLKTFDESGRRFERDSIYHFGYPQKPYKPAIANTLSNTYYRGNDQRTSVLQHNGNYLTCTFDLSACDSQGQQLAFDQNLHSTSIIIRLDLTRAPHTPDRLYSEELMSGVKITDECDLDLVRDMEGVRLKVLEADKKWRGDFPVTLKEGRNNGVLYVWESRVGFDKNKLYPKMHYAIEYDITIKNNIITKDSNLWMGFIRTAKPLREFKMTHDEWLSLEPLQELSKPNKSSAVLNDNGI